MCIDSAICYALIVVFAGLDKAVIHKSAVVSMIVEDLDSMRNVQTMACLSL